MPEPDSEERLPPDAPGPVIELSGTLREAFEVVVDDHAKRLVPADPPAPPPKPVGWMIAAAASWAALLILLLFPPAMVRRPTTQVFAAPPELRAASLRFGLWLARHRVEAFERSAARLPSHLGEAGVDDPNIILEGNGRRRYTLIGREGSVALRLTSEMSADSFLGESHAVLAASRAYQQAGIPGFTTAR